MHRRAFIFFGLLFCLVLSLNVSSIASSPYLVGVKVGEKYTFVMEEYNEISESPNREPRIWADYIFVSDEGSILIEDGDEFTYTILNSTLHDRSTEPEGSVTGPDGTKLSAYLYPWVLDVEITGPNGTTILGVMEIGFESINSGINQTTYRYKLDEIVEYYTKQKRSNPDISYMFEIVDTNTEFGYKYQEVFSGNDSEDYTYSDIRERRYEKKTGVANMIKTEFTRTDVLSSGIYKTEFIVDLHRKGYTSDGEDTGLLPGFTIYISFTTLLVLIYQRRK